MLAGSERALKGDHISPLECHRQLLEQVDGLFVIASDGRRSPSDFAYYIYLNIKTELVDNSRAQSCMAVFGIEKCHMWQDRERETGT